MERLGVGWECRLGQAAAVPAVPLRGREMPPQPDLGTAQLRTRSACALCSVSSLRALYPSNSWGHSSPKEEELLSDDGDDIMAATLGFGDSPKAEACRRATSKVPGRESATRKKQEGGHSGPAGALRAHRYLPRVPSCREGAPPCPA